MSVPADMARPIADDIGRARDRVEYNVHEPWDQNERVDRARMSSFAQMPPLAIRLWEQRIEKWWSGR